MAKREFAIPERSRRVEFALEVPDESKSQAWLRIGVGHGYDESGGGAIGSGQEDNSGVEYELQAADGTVVMRGSTASMDVEWFVYRVDPGSNWQFVATDADCRFEGGSVGNACSLTVELLIDAGK